MYFPGPLLLAHRAADLSPCRSVTSTAHGPALSDAGPKSLTVAATVPPNSRFGEVRMISRSERRIAEQSFGPDFGQLVYLPYRLVAIVNSARFSLPGRGNQCQLTSVSPRPRDLSSLRNRASPLHWSLKPSYAFAPVLRGKSRSWPTKRPTRWSVLS